MNTNQLKMLACFYAMPVVASAYQGDLSMEHGMESFKQQRQEASKKEIHSYSIRGKECTGEQGKKISETLDDRNLCKHYVASHQMHISSAA